MSLVQPSLSVLLNIRGCCLSIDLWDAVKGSQQGNGAHSFFIRIAESCGFDPSGSDSLKLGDKPIAVPGTFNFVDWQHLSRHAIIDFIFYPNEKKKYKQK